MFRRGLAPGVRDRAFRLLVFETVSERTLWERFFRGRGMDGRSVAIETSLPAPCFEF